MELFYAAAKKPLGRRLRWGRACHNWSNQWAKLIMRDKHGLGFRVLGFRVSWALNVSNGVFGRRFENAPCRESQQEQRLIAYRL